MNSFLVELKCGRIFAEKFRTFLKYVSKSTVPTNNEISNETGGLSETIALKPSFDKASEVTVDFNDPIGHHLCRCSAKPRKFFPHCLDISSNFSNLSEYKRLVEPLDRVHRDVVCSSSSNLNFDVDIIINTFTIP